VHQKVLLFCPDMLTISTSTAKLTKQQTLAFHYIVIRSSNDW
jgi:hypothetical protein